MLWDGDSQLWVEVVAADQLHFYHLQHSPEDHVVHLYGSVAGWWELVSKLEGDPDISRIVTRQLRVHLNNLHNKHCQCNQLE